MKSTYIQSMKDCGSNIFTHYVPKREIHGQYLYLEHEGLWE